MRRAFVLGVLRVIVPFSFLAGHGLPQTSGLPLSSSHIFPVELITESKDPDLKEQLHLSLLAKVQSVDGAYIVQRNPGWRIRVHALRLPKVEGFGIPVVASVVVTMVAGDGPSEGAVASTRSKGVLQDSPGSIANESIVFHYQLAQESSQIDALVGAIVDHLEEQVWVPFRRGTRAVLGGGATRRSAPSVENSSSMRKKEAAARPTKNYFTIGSSIEDVLRVQGEPTGLTDYGYLKAYEWGSSTVTFVNGKVSEFQNRERNLRIRVSEPK